MWMLFVLVAVLLVLIIQLIRSGRENYGIIEEGNIPVVPASLFLGSEVDLHHKVQHLEDIERFKKFGGVWGTYLGKSPQVHLADPDLIRLVFVKDSEYFHNRQEMDFGSHVMNEILDYLPGEKWKTVRNLLSPLFTTSKLNAMSDVIAATTEEFIDDLIQEAKASSGRVNFDIRNRLSASLIDMFAQTVMGIRMENSKDPNNWFAESFRRLIGEDMQYSLLYTLSLTFPWLYRFAPMMDDSSARRIESTFKRIMADRKASGSKNTKDFLDLLVEQADRCQTDPNYKRLGITEGTIISQAVNFFLGGYETTTTVMTHLLVELAKRPQVQEKIKAEVEEILEKFDGKITHDAIKDSEIPYTLGVVKEALRFAPPLLRPERICTSDWTCKEKGISIKKGTIVMIAAWAANRNPDVYESPDDFVPERWFPENKDILNPYAFSSFGFGPRNCIGMRFAYEDMKLLVCNLIRHFTIELRDDTKMDYKKGSTLIVAFDSPVYVDLVRRN